MNIKSAAFPDLSQSGYRYKVYKQDLVKLRLPFNSVFPDRSAETIMGPFFMSSSELVSSLETFFG